MGNTFTLTPGLDELVAIMVKPRINEIAAEVQLEAKRLAPGTKVWVTMNDGRVCTHCQPLHLTEIPENLRFKAQSYEWDIQHRGVEDYTYLLYPGDVSAGATDLVMLTHCRCFITRDPEGLARKIEKSPAKAVGPFTFATISITGEYVVEAEDGTVYGDGRHIVVGERFMQKAAINVARRRRGLSGGGNLPPPTYGSYTPI